MLHMQNIITYLHGASDRLSDILNIERMDWDSVTSMSDEAFEEYIDHLARTTHAPNTTPLWT